LTFLQSPLFPSPPSLQVGQFKRLLGVKSTPQHDLKSIPVVVHPKTLELPDQFDARTAWSQCRTIGKILGWLLVLSLFFDFFMKVLICFSVLTSDILHLKDQVIHFAIFMHLDFFPSNDSSGFLS